MSSEFELGDFDKYTLEAFVIFENNFNYVAKNKTRISLLFFSCSELTASLEEVANKIIVESKNIRDDNQVEDKIGSFLNCIDRCIVDVKGLRMNYATTHYNVERTGEFTGERIRYKIPFKPGNFEKELGGALLAMKTHLQLEQKARIDKQIIAMNTPQKTWFNKEAFTYYYGPSEPAPRRSDLDY